MSEIRKNWTTLSDNAKPASVSANTKEKSLEDVLLRLEALSSAYTDIQDRLYELDKSWKNNLMIYGVPCCDGEEDDPVITEEKVKLFTFVFYNCSKKDPSGRSNEIFLSFPVPKETILFFTSFRNSSSLKIKKLRLEHSVC